MKYFIRENTHNMYYSRWITPKQIHWCKSLVEARAFSSRKEATRTINRLSSSKTYNIIERRKEVK